MDNGGMENIEIFSLDKEKEKKNKTLYIFFVIILILGILLFFIKHIYESKRKEFFIEEIEYMTYENMRLGDKWKIEAQSIDNSEYWNAGNIKMLDISKDFYNMKTFEAYSSKTFAFYNESEDLQGIITYTESPKFLDALKKKGDIIEDNTNLSYVRDFLNRHNFKSDLELYKYLLQNKDNSFTIKDSYNDVKEGYIIKYITHLANIHCAFEGELNEIEGLGDNFYVFNQAERTLLIIENSKTVYKIDFYSDEKHLYFTDDKIKGIISTIKII